LIFDFDGVFTNNQVLVMEDGAEGVLCDRSDGLGVGMLKRSGLAICVLSAEVNPVVSRRCQKLQIDCVQGVHDKAAGLRKLLTDRAVPASQCAYAGNDVNDVPCMDIVREAGGVAIAVADAWPGVERHATFITTRLGGRGAVREICDWFLAVREHPTA
jgi:YrbI family 3-deoxy-D-manno-octulosonate 8-phosphate phosphatase